MPTLADRLHCSGCTSCQSVCPKSAIEMIADKEGFLYPQVNGLKCVRCGLCEKACPVLHCDSRRTPIAVYAAMAKDDELRQISSSGGMFSLLARRVLKQGGVVYGAGFDGSWQVTHKAAESDAEMEELRGSKYVQSDVRGVYASVRSSLASGREVMFSGTPCQISGLRHYLATLGVSAERLLLVDVICHAVPSPMVWRKYLNERLAKAGSGALISRIAFRHKHYGWNRFSMALDFTNGKAYCCEFRKDPFVQAFLKELCNRPSCYSCAFRGLRSGADITIGDYWGVKKYHPEMDDDRGTSLVLVNTARGRIEVESVLSKCKCCLTTYEEALAGNRALELDHRRHENRNRFLKKCRTGFADDLSWRMLKPSWFVRVRSFAGKCLRKFGFP